MGFFVAIALGMSVYYGLHDVLKMSDNFSDCIGWLSGLGFLFACEIGEKIAARRADVQKAVAKVEKRAAKRVAETQSEPENGFSQSAKSKFSFFKR